MPSQTPSEYVNKNTETLTDIIKHSQNTFTRALALAALVEYGDDPSVDEVIADIERLRDSQED